MGYRGNGLKLRAKKGVGYGRALPSAFGFDNGIYPDGSDDYLSISYKSIMTYPFTLEFWIKGLPSQEQSILYFSDATTSFNLTIYSNGFEAYINNRYAATAAGSSNLLRPDRNHFILSFNASGTASIYINGLLLTAYLNSYIPTLGVPVFFGISKNNDARKFKYPTDDYRVYNKELSKIEALFNYNNGLGSNPKTTENLKLWLQFQQFETLDFSEAQDNSDLRLGIRDMSGNNNHAQPINMQTNPALAGYVLQPF